MSDFEVRINQLQGSANDFNRYAKSLGAIATECSSILSQVRGGFSTRFNGIVSKVSVCGNVKVCQIDMSNLSKVLSQAAQTYLRFENNVKNLSFADQTDSNSANKRAGKKPIDNLPSLNGFNLTEEFLDTRNGTKDAILFGLTRNLLDGILGFIKKDDINDQIYKKQIRDLIDRYNGDTGEDIEDLLKFIKENGFDPINGYNDILEIIEKGGGKLDWLKSMSPEEIKTISKYLKYGTKGLEAAKMILTDYSNTIKGLANLRNTLVNSNGDPRIINYIDELTAECNDKFGQVLNMGYEMAVDYGADKLCEWVGDVATGGLLNVATVTQEIVWNSLELGSKGDTLASIYASNQYSDDLVRSYNMYAEKLKSGNYTQADYDNCKASFELAKQAKIQEYENIKEFSTSETKEYIDQEIEKLKSLSWKGV